jgi:hypothetical protein
MSARAYPLRPGVSAAGHVTTGGAWHPGAAEACVKCDQPPTRAAGGQATGLPNTIAVTAGERRVILRRLDALQQAITADDAASIRFIYDQLRSAVERAFHIRGRAYDTTPDSDANAPQQHSRARGTSTPPTTGDRSSCSCRSGYANNPLLHNNQVRASGRCRCACHHR